MGSRRTNVERLCLGPGQAATRPGASGLCALAALRSRRAAVFRRFPFTIILQERSPEVPVQPLRLKIDPGSKTTGLALVNDATGGVVWAAELTHRGQQVRKHLTDRRAVRRSRRQRKTRYRHTVAESTPQAGLAATLQESRIANVMTWVARLRRLCPIAALSQELVKFDTQLLEHPEIAGVEYQQGTLAGYELREYLLEKWERRCAYCHKADVPLQIEHLTPRARGGSNRVSNLTLACEPCNVKKGAQTAAEFGFPELQAQAKQPLKDAAAVNATRWALYERLKATGLPLEVGTGGRNQVEPVVRNLPKTHWLDAACVGTPVMGIISVGRILAPVGREACSTSYLHRKTGQEPEYDAQKGNEGSSKPAGSQSNLDMVKARLLES